MNKEIRDKLLWELNQRDYIRELHKKIKEALIGNMLHDYLGDKSSEQYLLKGSIFTPVFHAVVDMLVAHLIYEMSGKLLDEVLEEISDNFEIKEKED